MKILNVTLLLLCIFSCTTTETTKEKIITSNEFVNDGSDSLIAIIDSSIAIIGKFDPKKDSFLFSSKCISTFNKLAISTNGYTTVIVEPQLLTKTITKIIDSNCKDFADILLLIDKTGSMADDIENVKTGLSSLISQLSTFKNINFGVATYGDKNVDGADWYSFADFGTEFKNSKEFISKIQTTGGGDYPESVYDGIAKSIKQNFWKSRNKRILILVGDAPSLEGNLSEHSIDEVINLSRKENINLNLYPIVLSPMSTTTYEYKAPEIELIKKDLIKSILTEKGNSEITLILKTNKTFSVQIFDNNELQLMDLLSTDESMIYNLYSFKNGTYKLRVIDSLGNYDERKFTLIK